MANVVIIGPAEKNRINPHLKIFIGEKLNWKETVGNEDDINNKNDLNDQQKKKTS